MRVIVVFSVALTQATATICLFVINIELSCAATYYISLPASCMNALNNYIISIGSMRLSPKLAECAPAPS